MNFRFDRFYQLNRKAIIWIVLFVLIYELRQFFTLIFLTFIIGFFAMPAATFLQKYLRLSRGFSVIMVYATLFVGYIALYFLIIPGVISQVTAMQAKLPSIKTSVYKLRDDFVDKHQGMANLIGVSSDPSLLREEDLVRAPKKFYDQLITDSQSPTPNPGRRIMELLPGETQEMIFAASERKNPPSIFEPDPKFDPKIIGDINEHVLKRRDFYHAWDFGDVDLNKNKRIKEMLAREHNELAPREVQRLNRMLVEVAYPDFFAPSQAAEDQVEAFIDQGLVYIQGQLPKFAGYAIEFCVFSVLAIFFSFLITYDYVSLVKEVRSLGSSKLRDFYEEAGQPVVNFTLSVGYGFQAIVIIALIGTMLTIPGLVLLRIHSIALLSVIVFLTSLLPVVGIPLEAGAIMLVALNENGPEAAIWGGVMVIVIHMFIGYVVTPIIFGRQFHINLVAILIILFIGDRVGGVWGMILGVPIANYLLRDVFKVPIAAKAAADEAALEGTFRIQPVDEAALQGQVESDAESSIPPNAVRSLDQA